MKYLKMIILMGTIICVLLGILSGCSKMGHDSENVAKTRTVVDMKGVEVEVPSHIDNYAVAWTGDFDIAAMIDDCKHISAYPETSLKFPKVMEIYPKLKDCIPMPKINVSSESVLQSGAQVVFIRESDYPELTEDLQKQGVPVIDLNFENYDELVQAVYIFADVMNTDEARDKAKKYEEYVKKTVKETRAFVQAQDTNDVSVLNFRDANEYIAYSKDRLVGSWAELCGITYAMDTGDKTNNVPLTREQIYEYDPDYLFFTFPGNRETMLNDTSMQTLKAVQNGHVYDAPAVLNSFAVNGAEAVLQMKWAVSLIWPDQTTFDLSSEIKEFYKEFYDLDLNDEEILEIIGSGG